MTALEERITSHDFHFARVISWISSDLYKEDGIDEDDDSRYHKHKKRMSLDEKKFLRKKKQKEMYSIENWVSKSEYGAKGIDSEDYGLNTSSNTAGDGSLDLLRQRLKQKIIGLKDARTSKKQKVVTVSKKPDRSSKKTSDAVVETSRTDALKDMMSESHKKHKKGKRNRLDDSDDDDNDDQGQAGQGTGGVSEDGNDTGDVAFSGIRGLGDSNKKGSAGSKAPGSKKQRLQRMLDEAEKKRRRLEDLKAQGEAGKKIAQNELWGDIIKEAAGEKVNIDVTKIKKALKRKEKAKEKSAIKWKERKDAVESAKNAKIDRREANLEARQGKNQGKPVVDTDDASRKMTGSGIPVSPRGGFEGKKTKLLNGRSKTD